MSHNSPYRLTSFSENYTTPSTVAKIKNLMIKSVCPRHHFKGIELAGTIFGWKSERIFKQAYLKDSHPASTENKPYCIDIHNNTSMYILYLKVLGLCSGRHNGGKPCCWRDRSEDASNKASSLEAGYSVQAREMVWSSLLKGVNLLNHVGSERALSDTFWAGLWR